MASVDLAEVSSCSCRGFAGIFLYDAGTRVGIVTVDLGCA